MQKAATKSAEKTLKSIFIFRRDLRLFDNTGLIYALEHYKEVYPVFIFDELQVEKEKNKYFGSHSFQFMSEALKDLDEQLKAHGSKLLQFKGSYCTVLEKLLKKIEPKAVVVNRDYTPFAIKRDTQIDETCKKQSVFFKSCEDITLNSIDQSLEQYTGADVFFKKFTPYYNKVVGLQVRKTKESSHLSNLFQGAKIDIPEAVDDFGKKYFEENPKLVVRGGRKHGKKILEGLERLKNYDKMRDDPSQHTSQLSAYNKFGCVSVREVYWRAKEALKEKAEPFIRQLYWRDFYYFIALHYPHVFQGPMKHTYSQIEWPDDKEKLKAFCDGMTGCPIVDAAVRQMNQTGAMPNRCRMIVSNYLVKDLHINWQIGERYFASKLVDYDPSQNNGGWQWSAGCGVDSQPYFRVFNPVLQSQKFDPVCKYIKKWIPELKDVKVEDIHNWETAHQAHTKGVFKDKVQYPAPVVKTHAKAKEQFLNLYKASFDKTAPPSNNMDEELKENSRESSIKKSKKKVKTS